MGGFYNLVFGQNSKADAILATLDLTKKMVGRFRDVFVAEGEIAVYTRNGGGNRECWCREEALSSCPSHDGGPLKVWNRHRNRYEDSPDKRIRVCEVARTAECTCPGCIINHLMPNHPLYLRDVDDDFDSTYATIYFRIPEEWRAELEALDIGEWQPSERWQAAIDALKQSAEV